MMKSTFIKWWRATRRAAGLFSKTCRMRSSHARSAYTGDDADLPEWRIHFHLPLHAQSPPPFEDTSDHLLAVLDVLAQAPQICSHLEMETYTWEVLPEELKEPSPVDQVAAEYAWTLDRLRERGLA